MHLASLWPPFEGVLGDQAEQPGQQWWVIKSNGFRTPAKLLILTLSQRLKHVHGFITSSVKCNFLDSLEDTNQSLQKSWQGLLFPLDDLPSHYSQLPIVYLTGSWNSQVIPNFIKNSNLLSCMWENNTFHDSISYVHRGENGSKQLVWLIQNLGKLLKKDNQKNFKTQSTKLRHPTQLAFKKKKKFLGLSDALGNCCAGHLILQIRPTCPSNTVGWAKHRIEGKREAEELMSGFLEIFKKLKE